MWVCSLCGWCWRWFNPHWRVSVSLETSDEILSHSWLSVQVFGEPTRIDCQECVVVGTPIAVSSIIQCTSRVSIECISISLGYSHPYMTIATTTFNMETIHGFILFVSFTLSLWTAALNRIIVWFDKYDLTSSKKLIMQTILFFPSGVFFLKLFCHLQSSFLHGIHVLCFFVFS